MQNNHLEAKQSTEHAWIMVDFTFFAKHILECIWIVLSNREIYITIHKRNYRDWNRNP